MVTSSISSVFVRSDAVRLPFTCALKSPSATVTPIRSPSATCDGEVTTTVFLVNDGIPAKQSIPRAERFELASQPIDAFARDLHRPAQVAGGRPHHVVDAQPERVEVRQPTPETWKKRIPLPAGRFESTCDDGAQRPAEHSDVGEQLGLVRHDKLRGGGRRRRSNVRHEVRYGVVGLVPYGTHDRHTALEDRPRHVLLVEGPEVFQRAATARDDGHVDVIESFQRVERRNDGADSLIALHQGRRQHKLHGRVTAGRHVLNVVPDGTRRRGNDTYPHRKSRQRPLA